MSLTLRQSYPSLRRLARAAFGHPSFLLQFFFFWFCRCLLVDPVWSSLVRYRRVATLVRVIEIGVLRGEASR